METHQYNKDNLADLLGLHSIKQLLTTKDEEAVLQAAEAA